MTEEIYDASNEKLVKDREKKNRLRYEQDLEDIKTILSTYEGRRFFRRLFAEGHIFQSTFRGNSHSFFLEGERNLALKFFGDIVTKCPEYIPDLIINKEDGNARS